MRDDLSTFAVTYRRDASWQMTHVTRVRCVVDADDYQTPIYDRERGCSGEPEIAPMELRALAT
jgi:hypothetical protein